MHRSIWTTWTRAALALGVAAAVAGCGNGATTDMATNADMAVQHAPDDFGTEIFPDGGPNAAPTTAVVTTSSFMTSGAINTIKLADKSTMKAIDATIDQDNVVRAGNDRVYVLDRTHGTLRIYDPTNGFKQPTEVPTGDVAAPHEMSNPHDVLPIPSSSKLYVALYNNDADHSIAVVDQSHPDGGTPTWSVVKWIPIPKAGSRSPRANNLYFCGPMVYAVVEDLDDMYAVTGPGRVVVIDPRTDALDATMMPNVITLAGKNPGGGAQDGVAPVDPKSCDQVLVADTGEFGKPLPAGGGIELVDLTRRLSKGFVVTDSDLMGGPGTVASVGVNLAYTITNNADFTTSVVALDPTNKKVLGKVFGPAGFIPFAQVSPDKQLFVGVAHGDTKKGEPAPGVYVGPANGMPLPAMNAIDLGQAPYEIAFY